MEGPVKTPKRQASNCKFARPTIEEPRPLWLSAEDQPWSCDRLDQPRPLDDTDICEDCPHWQKREPDTR